MSIYTVLRDWGTHRSILPLHQILLSFILKSLLFRSSFSYPPFLLRKVMVDIFCFVTFKSGSRDLRQLLIHLNFLIFEIPL